MTDGTSNTLFVGERSSNLAYGTWTGSVTGGQVPPKIPDLFSFGPEGTAPILILGHTGDASDVPPHTPNSPVNHVDDFWSRHPLGVNFLFVDGSVQQHQRQHQSAGLVGAGDPGGWRGRSVAGLGAGP